MCFKDGCVLLQNVYINPETKAKDFVKMLLKLVTEFIIYSEKNPILTWAERLLSMDKALQ